tara:strand:- start:553 stop:951 length:399 start_codon:yes stop_codon:yes gene_type:complete
MTRVDGRPLYHLLKEGETSSKVLRNLGSLIRRLHIQGVSHGDLTTHNVMITDDGTLFLIDFGLSRKSPELEHMGLDLQVLNECLGASHSTIIDGIEAVCEGYLNEEGVNNSKSAETVIDRFNKITGRVRYHG